MLEGLQFSALEFNDLVRHCESNYGPINRTYLLRSMDVINDLLSLYPRLFAIRVDLRFARETLESDVDSLICMQRSDTAVISRFGDSLKSQLREDHARNDYRGESVLSFIWCREIDSSYQHHYHVVLLLNRDVYAHVGNYQNYDSQNMGTRVQRAWCSALGLPYPDYGSLVHFPTNPSYKIDRKSVWHREPYYYNFLYRVAYLSKEDTKAYDYGGRNFGCSHLKLPTGN